VSLFLEAGVIVLSISMLLARRRDAAQQEPAA
jgi:hypothetical protein